MKRENAQTDKRGTSLRESRVFHSFSDASPHTRKEIQLRKQKRKRGNIAKRPTAQHITVCMDILKWIMGK